MKRIVIGLFSLCLWIMLAPTALAATERLELEDITIKTSSEETNAVQLLSVEEWKDYYTCYRDQLDEDAISAYDNLVNAFENDTAKLTEKDGETYWLVEAVITDNLKYSGEKDLNEEIGNWFNNSALPTIQKACSAFLADHPEYFWVRGSYTMLCKAQGYVGNVDVSLDIYFAAQPSCSTEEDRNNLQEQINTVVNELLQETAEMTVVEKLSYWDNWLAANNEYNSYAAGKQNYILENDTPWSIAGAFLQDCSPVCEGYAKAFQLLCHEAGIPCLQISGYADADGEQGPEQPEGHMWIAVQVEGKWYLSDPTWDDPIVNGETLNYSSKEYFLVAQTDSHYASMDLITPQISNYDYDALISWEWTEEGLSGHEVGVGAMIIALFDENGRLVACDFCESSVWSGTEYLYTAPTFAKKDLEKTHRILRFNVDTINTFIPINEMREIH